MYHTTPFQNTFFMCFAVFILLLSIVIIIIGIILIHDLPYHIARRRNHPQQDAIRCMAVMGLVLFPLWLLSMVWAYMRSGVSYIGPQHEKKDISKDDISENYDSDSARENEKEQVVKKSDVNNTVSLEDDRLEGTPSKTEKVQTKDSENSGKSQTQE